MRSNEKEIERIRWEYLKRSEPYRSYCQLKTEEEKAKNTEDNEIRTKLIIRAGKYFTESVQKREKQFERLYKRFGNIHIQKFEKYWNSFLVKKKNEEKQINNIRSGLKSIFPQVQNFADVLSLHLSFAKLLDDEEPKSPEEAIESIRKSLQNQVCLLITQITFTLKEAEDLTKQVEKILKSRVPKTRFTKDELERYLKVYDMRIMSPPKKYKDIHEWLYPKSEFTENARRARLNDFSRAKNIINNVEYDKRLYWVI